MLEENAREKARKNADCERERVECERLLNDAERDMSATLGEDKNDNLVLEKKI